MALPLPLHDQLLALTQAQDGQPLAVIQSLWSGYGSIERYGLMGGDRPTVVVKHINLEVATDHPRGWNTTTSHLRKERSYQVEAHWYRTWSGRCTEGCRVPEYLGGHKEGQQQWIVLEDLDLLYPGRRAEVTVLEMRACLRWLAHFHATFLEAEPTGLWPIGSYWHLATRPDELARMEYPTLRAKAHRIDQALNEAHYQTIIHGDAKLANFCFSADGHQVAAVDFQYVGGGVGIKDVAYFLGSCFSSDELFSNEEEALNFYFKALRSALEKQQHQLDFATLEQEWRGLYPFAIADFTRFLLGWMPEHHKVNAYHLRITEDVLEKVVS